MRSRAPAVEFMFIPGCCCAEPALRLLRQVLAEEGCDSGILIRLIGGEGEAIRRRFCGSPTILIDGVDLEGPSVRPGPRYLRCRIYQAHGDCPGVPDAELIRAELRTHPGKRQPSHGG